MFWVFFGKIKRRKFVENQNNMIDLEKLQGCLGNAYISECVGNVLNDFSISELEPLLGFLIQKFKSRKDLLKEFWSDACPLEDTQREEQLLLFKKWIAKEEWNEKPF